jgi:hypothetical protein
LTRSNGFNVCYIQSLLFAAFDTSVGVVSGSGTGSMQFGAARLLLVLQAADNTPEAAATSEFKLDFGVNLHLVVKCQIL